MNRLALSLLATSVVVASSAATSAMVLTYVPKGPWRERAEHYLIAPGQVIYERLEGAKPVKELEKAGEKKLEKGQDKVQDAADKLKGELDKSAAGAAVVSQVSRQAERLPHLLNIGAWAVAGFGFCFIMTLMLGISTLESALALGFKVTLTMFFLQGALVFGGLLALQRMAG